MIEVSLSGSVTQIKDLDVLFQTWYFVPIVTGRNGHKYEESICK